VSFAAEPYAQFVDDLLNSLTGGLSREEFRFLKDEEPYRLIAPGAIISSSVRVYGQASAVFRRFQNGTDYKVLANSTIDWQKTPDGKPAAGAAWPDEGTYFYANFDYAAPPGAEPQLTDRNPGSVTRLLAESFAREYAVLSKQLDGVYKAAFLDTASGRDLDQVAALVGVQRRTPTFAAGSAVFGRSTPAPADIVIPAGMRLSTSQPPVAVFETTESVTLRRGSLSAEASIQSLEAGQAGIIRAEVISIMNQPVLGVESVHNPQPTAFSADPETDPQLRQRTRRSLEGAGRSTVGALLSALTSIPGVREKDIQILEDPIARPGLIQVNVALPDALGDRKVKILRQVTELIEDTRPVGVRVFHNVDAPRPAGAAEPGPGVEPAADDNPVVFGDAQPGQLFLLVDFIVRLRPALRSLSETDRAALERDAEKVVRSFVDDAGIGETLVYNKLVAKLMSMTGIIDVEIEMFPQADPSKPRRKNLVPSSPTVRPVAGNIDVQAGGSLIVIDLNITVTRQGAALQTPKETVSSVAAAEILEKVNAAFRKELPAQISVNSLRALAGTSDQYTIKTLRYNVEFLDSGVRMQQENVNVLPGAGDQFWIRNVHVEAE
jgi:phage-related baseplate assembly protein